MGLLLPLLVVISILTIGGVTGTIHVALFKSAASWDLAVLPSGGARGNLKGQPGEGYYITMTVGTPPQMINVLVDTGSSNFAIAAAAHEDITNYFDPEKSTTFKKTNKEVYVPYTQGNWKGILGRDVISIPSVSNESVMVNVAAITSSENFFINGSQWQGILGLAYRDIARPDSSVEPFFDTFVRGTNTTDIFCLQLCGTVDQGNNTDVSVGGTMVIGGLDAQLYKGSLYFANLRRPWYYEVIVTDIKVKDVSLDLDCKEYNFDKTIVDSGTTNLRLPNTVFTRLTQAVMKEVSIPDKPIPPEFWTGEEVLCWQTGAAPWHQFPTISISLAASNTTTIKLTVSAQQYLRQISEAYTSAEQHDCYKYAVSPSDSGTVIGAVIMEGFYVIFDRQNHQIGFGKSTCRNSDQASISGPLLYIGNTEQCGYNRPAQPPSTLVIAAYVMAGICAICLLPVLLMVGHWQVNRCRQRKNGENLDGFRTLLKEDDTDR